jgi:colanic acid biosynthesis protein WcaH
MMSTEEAATIESLVVELGLRFPDARAGLPQDLFYLVSRLTPLVNVDLLIQNEKGETLLVWREDVFYKGWHIAGGILRFKELAADRIKAVADAELGATVSAGSAPLAIFEKMNHQRDVRGHFIALLYRCELTSPLDEARRCVDVKAPLHGQWAWHHACPDNLLYSHQVYRRFFADGN